MILSPLPTSIHWQMKKIYLHKQSKSKTPEILFLLNATHAFGIVYINSAVSSSGFIAVLKSEIPFLERLPERLNVLGLFLHTLFACLPN